MNKLVILIPERDRNEHKDIISSYLPTFLEKQKIDYIIVFIHQTNDNLFNRAALFNIGYKYLIKYNIPFDYMCFHDIDLLPQTPECDYTYDETPKQLVSIKDGIKIDKDYFGGVTILTRKNFEKINGFSNQFEGWGGEDNDLKNRLYNYDINTIIKDGVYNSLPHTINDFTKNPYYNNSMSFTKLGTEDGLNNMDEILIDSEFNYDNSNFEYKILNIENNKNFIHIKTDFMSRYKNKNIKLALCLYGFPKCYEDGYKDIKNYILDKYPNTDVYIHVWIKNNSKIPIPPWNFNNKEHMINETVASSLINMYNPKKLIIEDPDKFNYNLDDETRKKFDEIYKTLIPVKKNHMNYCLKHNPSMFYSMTESTNMINFNNNYNFVIRTRFDIKLLSYKLPDIHILLPNYLHIATQFDKDKKSCCDEFMICDGKIAKDFFDIFTHINEYYKKGIWSPQDILMEYIIDKKIPILRSFRYYFNPNIIDKYN